MNDELLATFTLPVPPTSNHRLTPMIIKGKPRVFKSTKYKKYLDSAKESLLELGLTPFSGPVRVDIRWYRPRRVGDVDGPIKPILDCMSDIVYLDDKQVEKLNVVRGDDKENPRVEVKVYAL